MFLQQVKTPTIICHDEHEYIFEGFSMFSHGPLGRLPVCKVIRFNIEYTILYIEEKLPENFVIRELDLFCKYDMQNLVSISISNIVMVTRMNGSTTHHLKRKPK